MTRPGLEITSRVAPIALAYAHTFGLDPKALIERHQLPKDTDWRQPGKVELTLPTQRLKDLLDDVAKALNDKHLGLNLARSLPRGAYGVAEFLVRSAPTVQEAVDNLVRFNGLLAPNQQFVFTQTRTEGEVSHGIIGHPSALSIHHHEYTSLIMVRTLKAMIDGANVNRIWFAHSALGDLAAVYEAFGTDRVEFDHPMNGFSFDRSLLKKPVKTGDPALFSFLEEHAVLALASRPRADDLIDRVRTTIREALKHGEPSIERIAPRLALSARTLQRRLSDLNTSFQSVLDDVRFDLSRAYLRDVRIDITQVAYLLGYSELRAFDRAFKRWAHVSPREWREQRPSA